MLLLLVCATYSRADGIFTVPKHANAISIDGKIDEAEGWGKAVRLSNFQLKDSVGFAFEQTTVWLTHDGDNLFIAMKMQAQVLLHASNQRARFLASVQRDDGSGKKLWEDDSVEVRLRPPWVKRLSADSQFYLIANANGACSTFAPKGGKQDWYRDGALAASMDEGFLTVEMSFPLKTFCKDGIVDADGLSDWGVNFIRFEKNRNETSSFANISGKSHLDTGLYANMTLAQDDSLPAIRMPDVTSCSINSIKVGHFTSKRFVAWAWGTTDSVLKPPKRFESSKMAVFDTDCAPVEVKAEFNAKGAFTWFYYFVFGKPVKCFFRSPAYPGNSDQGPVRLELKGAVESVKANGQTLKPQGTLEFFPRAGVNSVEIASRTPSFTLRASSTSGALPLHSWRYFDGGQWRDAKTAAKDGWLAVSAPEGRTEYTFAAKFNNSVTAIEWMGESDDFNLSAGGCGYFFWCPSRSGGVELKPDTKIALTLLLPSWMKVVGATSYQMDDTVPYWQGKTKFGNHYTVAEGPSMLIDGQECRTFSVSSEAAGKAIPEWDKEEILTYYRTRCMIVLQADASAAGRTGRIGYCMTVDGIPEVPSFRDATCLPALNGLQPKDIRFSMYLNQFSRCNNPEMLSAILRTFKAAGCTEAFVDNVHGSAARELDIGQAYFFHMRGGFSAQEADMRRVFAKYPQTRGWNAYANLAALNRLPEVWHMIDDEIAAIRKRDPNATNLFWDYEFPPFRHYSDSSEWTLNVFAKEYNITEWPLTEAIITEKYLKQWVDFRCRELARVIPKLRQLAHKHGFEFSLYGAPDPKWKDRYSFDWQMIAEEGGCDYIYFGGDWKAPVTESYLKTAKESNTPVCTSLHVCATDNTGWKRELIFRRLLLSRGGGICFWYEKGFDGAMLQEIAAASWLAAQYGEFFQKGECRAYGAVDGKVAYDDVNTTPEDLQRSLLGDVRTEACALFVMELGGRFLAVAANDTAAETKMTLRMNRAAGAIMDVESGKEYSPDKDIELVIPAYGYFAFTGKVK
ncbi:MAG: hypothetical protein J5833_05905 [Victivallales bacterium]|nr:hypothetical protein [Victivallales bacterium]